MITTISDKKVLDTFSRQIFFLGVPANNEELGIKLRTFTNDYDLGFKNDTTKVIKLYGYQEILPLISNDSILYVYRYVSSIQLYIYIWQAFHPKHDCRI